MMISPALLKFMPYRLRRVLHTEVRVRLDGKKLVIPLPATTDDGLQNVYWNRSWKSEILKCLVHPHDGAFIDVGANVGQTLLDLHLSCPGTQYVGFEPNVACVTYLRELIKTNSMSNCQILPVALADKNECRLLMRY